LNESRREAKSVQRKLRPGRRKVIAHGPSAEDVENALRIAAEAFKEWRRSTPAVRQLALLKLADAVEVNVPVVQAAILKREAVSGPLAGPELAGQAIMPAVWKHGRGTFSLTVSSVHWLSNLMGLPFLLDYPHGCFEQKSSRLWPTLSSARSWTTSPTEMCARRPTGK
jgi:hypothetical protein